MGVSPSATRETHWADVKESGALLGMRFLFGCYKLGGRFLFRLFLAPVMLYFFALRRDARSVSRDYLNRVERIKTGDRNAKVSTWRCFQHFWTFAITLIDKLAVWTGGIDPQRVAIHNMALLEQAAAAKQGGLILVSHLGNFEVSRCLAHRDNGVKLTVLVHTKHAAKFNTLMSEHDHSNKVELWQVTDITADVAMRLSEKVSQGEFIAIAADRVSVNYPEKCLQVEFLGEKAPLPIGPFVLASVLQVPVFSVFAIHEQDGYHIYFEPLAEGLDWSRKQRAASMQVMAERYANQLQHHCLRTPQQWFNFFNFWRLPERAQQPKQKVK